MNTHTAFMWTMQHRDFRVVLLMLDKVIVRINYNGLTTADVRWVDWLEDAHDCILDETEALEGQGYTLVDGGVWAAKVSVDPTELRDKQGAGNATPLLRRLLSDMVLHKQVLT